MDPTSAAEAGQLDDQGSRDHFMVFTTQFHLGVAGQLLVLNLSFEAWRLLTYCGQDSPVLSGEVAKSFGIELHSRWIRR